MLFPKEIWEPDFLSTNDIVKFCYLFIDVCCVGLCALWDYEVFIHIGYLSHCEIPLFLSTVSYTKKQLVLPKCLTSKQCVSKWVNAALLSVVGQCSLIGRSNGWWDCQLLCALLPKQLVNLKVCDMSQINVLSSYTNIGSLTRLITSSLWLWERVEIHSVLSDSR